MHGPHFTVEDTKVRVVCLIPWYSATDRICCSLLYPFAPAEEECEYEQDLHFPLNSKPLCKQSSQS